MMKFRFLSIFKLQRWLFLHHMKQRMHIEADRFEAASIRRRIQECQRIGHSSCNALNHAFFIQIELSRMMVGATALFPIFDTHKSKHAGIIADR